MDVHRLNRNIDGSRTLIAEQYLRRRFDSWNHQPRLIRWLILPVIAAVPIATMLSTTLQVLYFKWTGGKRLFKMAPLHHHFELIGWSETQIVQRWWLIAILAGMLGVALALI